MKQIYITLVLVFGFLNYSYGQILTFENSALAGGEATTTSNFNNANLNTSTLSRGAGLTAAANGGRYNATNWATSATLGTTDYMEFAIAPLAGFEFSVSSIVMNFQRSGTGPKTFAIRSSLDGYASDLATQTIADVTSTQVLTFTFSHTSACATAITYRFYGYNAESTSGSGGIGDGGGNDLIVNGTVTACAGGCNITNSGVSSISCNDNSTVPNTADDFITFDLNPTGSNLAATYNVTVSSGTITPTSATYGSATSFALNGGSAGSGNVTVTITDATDAGCTFDQLITDPGTCSSVCVNYYSEDMSGISEWENNDNWTTSGQLNSNFIGTDYISEFAGPQDYTLANYEWSFCMGNADFDPSGGNNYAFYFISNESDLTSGTQDGYAVGVNQTGTSDEIMLYEVTNGTFTPILTIPAATFNWNAADNVCFRVVRTSAGSFTLFYDVNGAGEVNGGTIIDVTHTTGGYMGYLAELTSSNATDFTADNISFCSDIACGAVSSPTSVSTSAVSFNQFDISWTGGGYHYIVVVSENVITGTPTNGTVYEADFAYNNGQDILNAGEYIVYNGSGLGPITVTGLIGSTTYNVAVFSHNCAPSVFNTTPTTASATTTVAPTITTGTLSPVGPFSVNCSTGDAVDVPFTITGTFTAGNVFTAQLSNSSGSFASPLSIGTLTSTAAGTISATIPAGIPSGNGYLIRVVSDNPVITGSSSSAFTITFTESGGTPYISSVLINACAPGGGPGCGNEGDNEILFVEIGDVSVDVNTSDFQFFYQTTSPATTTFTDAITTNAAAITYINANVCAGTNFIDANTVGTIPANGTVMVTNASICEENAFDWSSLCGMGDIYVIFSTDASWTSGGNFTNNGSGDRYFRLSITDTDGTTTTTDYSYNVPSLTLGSDGDYITYGICGGEPQSYQNTGAGCVLNPNLALPVTFLYQNAEYTYNQTVISWATASEINNKEFAIMRSIDGEYFEPIGSVPGTGSSSNINYYSFIDHNPKQGVNYYKIKQIDFDGQFITTDVMVVNKQNSEHISFSNGNNLIIKTSSDFKGAIDVYSVTGKLLHKKDCILNANETISFYLKPNQVYLIKLKSEEEISIIKHFHK